MTTAITTFVPSIINGSVKTMTSREMAYLTEKRHDNVRRTIEYLVEKGIISNPQIEDGIKGANGVSEKTYLVGKRDSFVVVAQLSPEFTARLVDRWQELEDAAKALIPNFDDPIAAAEAWLVEKKAVVALSASMAAQTLRIAHDAPKVEYVEKFIEVGFDMNLRDAWKSLHVSPTLFSKHLVDEGVLYEKGKAKSKHAYQAHIIAGHFVERQTNFGTQVYVTPKGKLYIAKKFADWIDENSTKQ